jgi:hypothetical protein
MSSQYRNDVRDFLSRYAGLNLLSVPINKFVHVACEDNIKMDLKMGLETVG